MRGESLRVEDMLVMPSKGGVMTFAGHRVLMVDAVALGLLRSSLAREFGLSAARGILTQLGYSHGWRTAHSMKEAVDWDNDHEWRRAGGRLHQLQGMVEFAPVVQAERDGIAPFADAIWKHSYEAEQHILHFGHAGDCVCWSLCGFASGYLSAAYGLDVYCIETSCIGRGDAVCHMVGKTKEEWGEVIEPHLVYYEKDCLETSLRSVRNELRKAEQKLQQKRMMLGDVMEDEIGGLIARSREMKQVLEMSKRVALVDSSVLVLGETGVGKERISQFIHEHSARAAHPFVALNCGALPEGLLESELFGYAKGAFTGAQQERAGLFEAARGGTLFLDEIGEISPTLQVRLLRVLETRTVRRLGENKDRPINFRLLAATHRNLQEAVEEGSFREDLYFRLRVVEIRIPPLRERKDDILPLVHKQLKETAHRFSRAVDRLSPDAARKLVAHDWPGNVRELNNAIERAVVFADGKELTLAELDLLTPRQPNPPQETEAPSEGVVSDTTMTLAAWERHHIEATLRATGGNKAEAARRLGIGVATLFRKLKKYQADETDGMN